MKLYEIAVEMADRVIARRQAANSFYLSINTAVIAGNTYLSNIGQNQASVMLDFAGLAICLLWFWTIRSYKALSTKKYDVIHVMESQFPFKLYTEEWNLLSIERTSRRRLPLFRIERLIPAVFALIFLGHILLLNFGESLIRLLGFE